MCCTGGKRKLMDAGCPKTTALRELSEETAGTAIQEPSLQPGQTLHCVKPCIVSMHRTAVLHFLFTAAVQMCTCIRWRLQ